MAVAAQSVESENAAATGSLARFVGGYRDSEFFFMKINSAFPGNPYRIRRGLRAMSWILGNFLHACRIIPTIDLSTAASIPEFRSVDNFLNA